MVIRARISVTNPRGDAKLFASCNGQRVCFAPKLSLTSVAQKSLADLLDGSSQKIHRGRTFVGKFLREEVSMGQLRRRRFLIASSALLAAPLVARAQKSERVHRIGVLFPSEGRSPYNDRFEKLLGDLGWIKGRNVSFIYRYSKVNDRLPALARELVRERVDIIVAVGTPGSLAAKQATTTIPVVFYVVGDPVGVGLVSSLNRPGGNVTGISGITYQLGAKRLEFLREVLPEARLFGFLLDRTDPTASQNLVWLKRGLGSAKLTIEPFYAERAVEIEPTFQMMKQRRVDGVLVMPDSRFFQERARIVKLAADLSLPAIYPFEQFVEAGGLMSYCANFLDMQAQAVAYVDKILRGSNPSGLPVQEPTKLKLDINLKTAKALGLKIPESLLLRADRMIE